jgi:hypothetical protein
MAFAVVDALQTPQMAMVTLSALSFVWGLRCFHASYLVLEFEWSFSAAPSIFGLPPWMAPAQVWCLQLGDIPVICLHFPQGGSPFPGCTAPFSVTASSYTSKSTAS